jgi:hypothetical protein
MSGVTWGVLLPLVFYDFQARLTCGGNKCFFKGFVCQRRPLFPIFTPKQSFSTIPHFPEGMLEDQEVPLLSDVPNRGALSVLIPSY